MEPAAIYRRETGSSQLRRRYAGISRSALSLLAAGFLLFVSGGCAQQVVAPPQAVVSSGAADTHLPSSVTDSVPLRERQGSLALDFPLSHPTVPAQTYSFHAVGIPIADALRLFARDSGLNIILDPGLEGVLTVDFEGVSLDDAMHAILDAHGYSWIRQGDLIRVHRFQTRTFEIDYPRLTRDAFSINVSGQFGVTGGGEETGADDQSNEYEVRQNNPVSFWDEITESLDNLVAEDGRVNINRTAGVVTVTTDATRMREVAEYLAAVKAGSLRQVRIEARIVEVELDDRNRLGIDWAAPNLAGLGRYDAGAFLLSGGGVIPGEDLDITSGLEITRDGSFRAVINALSEQGSINVVSQPKILALNNQTAQIRVATDTPYFVQTKSAVPGSLNVPAQPAQFEQRTASLGLVLQVTPHVAGDGWITLEIAPVITRSTGRVPSPDPEFADSAGPLIVDVKQTSVMARVRSGETVVLGGLIQDDARQDVSKVPLFGDLPMVGGLFRDTVDTSARKELVVFVTPVAEVPSSAQEAVW